MGTPAWFSLDFEIKVQHVEHLLNRVCQCDVIAGLILASAKKQTDWLMRF